MNAQSPHDAPQYVNMLLGQLYTNKITNANLLQVLANTPRENFVPDIFKHSAYIDEDIQIAPGRYMLAPLTFAQLLNLSEITSSERVLIVGGANGYAAMVFAQVSGHVVSIDTDMALCASARLQVKQAGFRNVDVQHVQNLADGYAMSEPYDVIFVNGALEQVPDALASQLSIGGRLVAIRPIASRPGSPKGLGKGIVVRRMDGQVNIREHFDASAPLLPGLKQTDQFDF